MKNALDDIVMNIDNQTDYWDKVAQSKTFTHPLNDQLLAQYINHQSRILDFGCGYGRTVNELARLGFKNVIGFDTSRELINRGQSAEALELYHLEAPSQLPVEDDSIDCIILFAVLTCIPSNSGQLNLINMLYSKLRQGGILYISDYYLQNDSVEMGKYHSLNNDADNYGVFKLAEGVIFRHHTQEWIAKLLQRFTVLAQESIDVLTMNKHRAKGFQLIARK